jgi:hypothetical protein
MRAAAPTAVRVIVLLMAVVATVGQIAYLDALAWHVLGIAPPMSARMRPPFLTLMTAHAAVSGVSALLAVALAFHRGSREAAARGLGLALGAWSYLTAYSGVTLLLRDSGVPRGLVDAHFLAVEVVGLAGIIRFSALFPRPLDAAALASLPPLPSALEPLHKASLSLLRPATPWLAGALALGALWTWTAARGNPLGDAGLHPAMDGVRFLAAGIVVVNLRRTWGRAEGEDRERLTWLLAALVILLGSLFLFIGGNVLMAVAEWPEPIVAWRPLLMDLGLVGFLVGLSMAVLYRGGLPATWAATRIASITSVGTLSLFLAAGLEALFTGGAMAGFSLRTGAGTVFALAIVLSTARGLMRSVEKGFAQMLNPGPMEESPV